MAVFVATKPVAGGLRKMTSGQTAAVVSGSIVH